MSETALFERIRSLWSREPGDPFADWLPRDAASLKDLYARLQDFVTNHPRSMEGSVDPAAIVRGEIVSMGPGSRIEAGATIHETCKLVLGANSVIRSGAVLRGEMAIDAGCTIGVNCEAVRSIVLGPGTTISHFAFVGDSVIGRDVVLSGYAHTANTSMRPDARVRMKIDGERIDSGRTHFGALIGDGARIGANVTICPGAVLMPGISVPPAVVLYGTTDAEACDRLTRRFYESWDLDRATR